MKISSKHAPNHALRPRMSHGHFIRKSTFRILVVGTFEMPAVCCVPIPGGGEVRGRVPGGIAARSAVPTLFGMATESRGIGRGGPPVPRRYPSAGGHAADEPEGWQSRGKYVGRVWMRSSTGRVCSTNSVERANRLTDGERGKCRERAFCDFRNSSRDLMHSRPTFRCSIAPPPRATGAEYGCGGRDRSVSGPSL